MIVIGADTHKSTHTLAAVDAATGRVAAARTVRADAAGMLDVWLRALSGRETARVLKLDQVDPVGVVDGDVADRHAPVDPLPSGR